MSRRRPCHCLAVLLLAAGWTCVAAAAPYRDDEVKAAFLFRFTGYVEWPPQAMESGRFTVCVLGSKPVGNELNRLFAKYVVKNLPASVRIVTTPQQALASHILYVGPDYAGSVRDVVAAVGSRPVLIVTDSPGALDEGSALNFLVVDRRVRFEVSVPATNRAGLKVSSQLLAVATRVRGASLLKQVEGCLPAAIVVPSGEGDDSCHFRVTRL